MTSSFITTAVIALLGLVGRHPTALAFAPSGNVRHASSLTLASATPPSVSSSSRLHMATWSDSRAVKDYQDFLSSGQQELQLKPDGPSVIIISPAEAGLEFHQLNPTAQALLYMGRGDDVVVTPFQPLPDVLGESEEGVPLSEYPIYITLPPQEVQPFLQNLDPAYDERNEDFCFFSGGLQYGNIEEVLKDNGYCRDAMTQVLISGMTVDENGISDNSVKLGIDAVGETKWAGESSACGKWNGAIAQRMERSQLRCNVDFYRDWRRKMWERNILDAVFNLVGAVREEPTTLQDVANYYDQEVSDIMWEITKNLRGWKAITLLYGFEERLFGVAEMTPQPCVLVDYLYPYIWGNKIFTESPKFMEYLWYAKEQRGMFQDVELPPMRTPIEGEKSVMIQGNLRADGVI